MKSNIQIVFCLIFSGFVGLLFSFALSAQGYQNPVIPGYYPDPSVCRVAAFMHLPFVIMKGRST